MLLSQARYVVALARERHFGRAAEASFVSQSTLSEAIAKLESELGVPLVRRGRRFEGFTPEGERMLAWARRLLSDERSLHEAVAAPDGLACTIRVGVVPTGTRDAVALLGRLATRHPDVLVDFVMGLSSEEIARRLSRFELDAGILYPVQATTGTLRVSPIGVTRQWVLGTESLLHGRTAVPAAELAELPVALLNQEMRGRQALDEALAARGIELHPHVETNSAEALIELAATGRWCSVLPRSKAIGPASDGVRWAELVEPRVVLPLLLGVHDDEPLSPVALALLRIARDTSDAPHEHDADSSSPEDR